MPQFSALTFLLKDRKFETLGDRVNRSLTFTQVFQDSISKYLENRLFLCLEGGAEHLRSLGQYHPATKRFSNKTCSQHPVTAHRGRASASPQGGMEKGQSGRKLRRKAEQAQDNTQYQSPILANTFFVLNTSSALLAQATPSPTHPLLGWWVVPWYILA